jgi:GDPmannose 4,6-dehydratase
MWLMLQCEAPRDYVIGTGETQSVGRFVEEAFDVAGMDWAEHVEYAPELQRPSEVGVLLADASKAREELNWRPKTSFRELVEMMVDADIELAKKEALNGI